MDETLVAADDRPRPTAQPVAWVERMEPFGAWGWPILLGGLLGAFSVLARLLAGEVLDDVDPWDALQAAVGVLAGLLIGFGLLLAGLFSRLPGGARVAAIAIGALLMSLEFSLF